MNNHIKDTNYFVVHGWMRNQLGLRGNALDLYAIIYGFSQTDHQEFTASINYLCEWLGVSRPTIINNLKDLVDKGLLTKESEDINGVIYCRYKAVIPDEEGSKKTLLPQSKNFTGGSKKILPNKEQYKEQNKENPKNQRFLGEQAPPQEIPKKLDKSEIIAEVYENPENEYIIDALRRYHKWFSENRIGYQGNTVAKWASLLREFAGHDPDLAMAIVNQSIEKGWKSLYPLKKSPKPRAVFKQHDPSKDQLATDAEGKPLVY